MFSVKPYPLTILHVLKHVKAVVNNSLQHLLVVVRTLPEPSQVGQNPRQQPLVVWW